jgi:6-pyruvoyltetrahydropterin/6-carboxytetrahydropterin synthase
MFTVTKQFRFEAAHSLPHLPEGHKCRNVHGHSYWFEVAVSSRSLDERGFVIDYAEIHEAVNPIAKYLDHQDLNQLFEFATTAENLAKWIYEEARHSVEIEHVTLKETSTTSVTYKP